jgi:hypothetical protein
MSVASAPSHMSPSSSDDPRSLPPFANLIALSSRAPLHAHSNSGYPETRYSLGPVPSSPDRGPKDGLRGSTNGARTSPGLDRANSTGKGSVGRAPGDELGSMNDDPDRPKRKRQSQSELKKYGSFSCFSDFISWRWLLRGIPSSCGRHMMLHTACV